MTEPEEKELINQDRDETAGQSAEAPRCPVCCSDDFTRCFRQYERDFDRCTSCGFVKMSSPPDLEEHYRKDRNHGELIYQEHDKFLKIFDSILAKIETEIPPGRFLDVGCSYGNSLVAARDRNWQVTGIELSKPAAEYGIKEHGLDIRTVHLHEADLEPGSFDAVLMHHTLEHLPYPDVVMQQVHDLLRPGGVHFQALPNYGALKRRILGAHWSYGITPDHLAYFTPRTLRRMLERLGFEYLQCSTPSIREDPRFLADWMRKLNRTERFMAKRGKPGQAFNTQEYLEYLDESRWARWLCTRAWPSRLVRWLGLGEEIYMMTRKPTQT